ncbi:hypothetical protein QO202_13795 [Aeromonas caviae]|jgi:hypothetical protein|uniref:hypothetical protein n=1 Tax=Aeromonas caviae TaxID=648 RepID=UPI002647AED6|nr:hypothetical protein [Aeromonas caviae]MDN6869089.1 hypothetical protein [Aeromonas caviae]
MDETIIILEKVNQFYSSSFNTLVSFTIGLLAFVGVIIPALITFYQNKQFKQEQNHILGKLDESKLEFVSYIDLQIVEKFKSEQEKRNKEIEDLRAELIKESLQAKGGCFFIQANVRLGNNETMNAMESYIDAIDCFIRAEDEMNLQRALNTLTSECFPKASKEMFIRWHDLEGKVRKIVERLDDINKNGRYADLKIKLIDSLNQALIR